MPKSAAFKISVPKKASSSIPANNSKPSFLKALLASIALHALVLLVATFITTTKNPHRQAVRSGIVVKLPSIREQLGLDTVHSHSGDSASHAPMSANTLSDSEGDFSTLGLKMVISQEPPLSDLYYRRNELSTPASPLFEPTIPQPTEQLEGIAELTLLIGTDGTVDTIQLGKSTLPPSYIDQLKALFSSMKFQPGMLHGMRVKSRFEIEVSATFAPEIIESRTLTDDPRPL